GLMVGCPDLGSGNTVSRPQAEIILAPARDVGVEELLERLRSPGHRVYAVGDCGNFKGREHQPRYLAMLFRDPVDVAAEIKGEICQVTLSGPTKHLFHFRYLGPAEYLLYQVHRESVLPGGHRCVSGEDTPFSD